MFIILLYYYVYLDCFYGVSHTYLLKIGESCIT